MTNGAPSLRWCLTEMLTIEVADPERDGVPEYYAGYDEGVRAAMAAIVERVAKMQPPQEREAGGDT